MLGVIQGHDEGLSVDAMDQWHKWWMDDELARDIDISHTRQYYGDPQAMFDDCLDDLGSGKAPALRPSILNTIIAHIQDEPVDSIEHIQRSINASPSRLGSLRKNVSDLDDYRYDKHLLRNRWNAFLTEVRKHDEELCSKLAA
ncbi:MAG: hypothetical protein HY051_01425 [Candidatus Aenigmarchaeota archaeon]|nr:hypothetical protein [Candidatus Aenigmarchaeota archaeon]